jgi:MSHA biogenesis protein MshN
MNSGRLEDAEKLLRELLGGSHDYSARKHLLVLYDRMKRPARVQSLLESSLQTYPQDPLLQTEYARLLFQSAAYARVIALLVSNSTLSADQHALIAASYQRLDQHQEAMLYYEQALLQDPQNARNWVGLGISQEYSSKHGEALASYQRAGRLGSLNERLRAFAAERSARLQQVVN